MDNIDPILSKTLFDQIGKEIANRQFAPGPQAKAVAAAMGDKSKVESLYIQFRFEDLLIEMKMQAEQEAIRKKQDEHSHKPNVDNLIKQAKNEALSCYSKTGSMPESFKSTCPKCGKDIFNKVINGNYLGFVIIFSAIVVITVILSIVFPESYHYDAGVLVREEYSYKSLLALFLIPIIWLICKLSFTDYCYRCSWCDCLIKIKRGEPP